MQRLTEENKRLRARESQSCDRLLHAEAEREFYRLHLGEEGEKESVMDAIKVRC